MESLWRFFETYHDLLTWYPHRTVQFRNEDGFPDRGFCARLGLIRYKNWVHWPKNDLEGLDEPNPSQLTW